MDERIASIWKYSFWNRNTSYLGLPRNLYINRIFEYAGNQIVKVLVGQRRVGKSYLLRQIASRLVEQGVKVDNILYINMGYVNFSFLSDYEKLEDFFVLYKSTFRPVGKIYIFIDEVHNIKNWERFVNSHIQDFTENCEIFITGSTSDLLSEELALLLSGKYVEFQVLPFSFSEYMNKKNDTGNLKFSYINYLKEGGLPELFDLPDEEAKHNYLSAVKNTIILRDISKRYNIKNNKLLEDLFNYLMNNPSNLLSVADITDYFNSKKYDTDYDTVSEYIAYIEDTFLIHTEQYNIRGEKISSGSYKYYINDFSFRNYLAHTHDIDMLLENAVYLDLIRFGYKIYPGIIKYKDVDFIAVKGSRIIYLQNVYLSDNQQKIFSGYTTLQSIPDEYEKYVISIDDLSLPSPKGIQHVYAWDLPNVL